MLIIAKRYVGAAPARVSVANVLVVAPEATPHAAEERAARWVSLIGGI